MSNRSPGALRRLRGRGKQGNSVLHTQFPSTLYVAPFVLAQERSQPISNAHLSAMFTTAWQARQRSTVSPLLALSAFRFADGLVIVRRIELSVVSAPGCLFDGDINFP